MSKKTNNRVIVVDTSKALLAAPVSIGASRKARRRRQSNGSGAISAPAAMSRTLVNRVPKIQSVGSGDGRIRVVHREYIKSVGPSSTDFACIKLNVQPGLTSVFPWLSGLARMYESYVFNTLHFEYVPACGTTTPGSVSLALDYDAFDTSPTSKGELMQNQSAVRGVPWSPLRLSASRANLMKFGTQRFTRQDDLAENLDIKTYDIAGLFVATDNAVAPLGNWGDLFVVYSVDLITPQAPTWDRWDTSAKIAKVVNGAAADPSHPFGTNAVADPQTKLPLTVSPQGNAVTINKIGQYILDFQTQGTVFNGTMVPAIQTLNGQAATTTLTDLLVGNTIGFSQIACDVTKVPYTFQPSFAGHMSTLTSTILRVVPWVYSAL